MSGKLIAVVKRRRKQPPWRYKLMVRVFEDNRIIPYWKQWSLPLSREDLDATLVELKLKGHIEEVVWPEDGDEPGSNSGT